MFPSSLPVATSSRFIAPLLPPPSSEETSSISESLLAPLIQTHNNSQSSHAYLELLKSLKPGRAPSTFAIPQLSDNSKLILDYSKAGIVTVLTLTPGKIVETFLFTPRHPSFEMISAIPQNLPLIAEWQEWANAVTDAHELRHETMEAMQECLATNGTKLTLTHNNLSTLPAHLPPSVKYLNVCFNRLTALPELPPTLRFVDVSYNKLTTLPQLPPEIDTLIASDNLLTQLPPLPGSLTELRVNNNHLTSLQKPPKHLHILDASYNHLTGLPDLSASPHHLFVANNQITAIPEVCGEMENLHVCDNPLVKLPQHLPSGLILTYSRNQTPLVNATFGINLIPRGDEIVSIIPCSTEYRYTVK